MSMTETMIWMAGAVILWAGMALIAVRVIDKRRHNDEH